MTELSETLKDWRRKWQLSSRQAGELLGISPRTLSGLEQGRSTPYAKVILSALEHLEPLLVKIELNKMGRIAAQVAGLDPNITENRIAAVLGITPASARKYLNDPAADAGTGGQGTRHRRRHARRDAAPR
jgi:predicted transcriptional regulator